ncbi:MAG: alpha/beta fold hydrolase, partial [Halobacteriaceae archaeon]
MPFAENDNVTLHYEIRGTRGPHVAFIQDACVGAWTWAWIIDSVASHYQAIAFDARGCGNSEMGTISIEHITDDLEAILGDADIQRVHLVGCGLGSQIALEYVRKYSRARSLLLIAAGRPRYGGERERLLNPDPITSLEPYVNDWLDDEEKRSL